MPEDTPMPAKSPKPRPVGPLEPVPYDYGIGKRIAPRRPRRPGEPVPLADGLDMDPFTGE
jgi:hypothetical protein